MRAYFGFLKHRRKGEGGKRLSASCRRGETRCNERTQSPFRNYKYISFNMGFERTFDRCNETNETQP